MTPMNEGGMMDKEQTFEVWWKEHKQSMEQMGVADRDWLIAKHAFEAGRRLSASAPAGDVVEEIKDMDKCVKCLALEVPGAVHDDVVRIWGNLKRRLASPGQKGVEDKHVS